MSKYDIYLQENSKVLKNKLNIEDEAALDKAESIMANTKMALLYNSSFSDFSPSGVCKIHKAIFGDVYEWAGEYRITNVQKREAILAGKSVWYSNWEDIDRDLKAAWQKSTLLIGHIYRMTILQNQLRAYSLPYGRHIRSERVTHEP